MLLIMERFRASDCKLGARLRSESRQTIVCPTTFFSTNLVCISDYITMYYIARTNHYLSDYILLH